MVWNARLPSTPSEWTPQSELPRPWWFRPYVPGTRQRPFSSGFWGLKKKHPQGRNTWRCLQQHDTHSFKKNTHDWDGEITPTALKLPKLKVNKALNHIGPLLVASCRRSTPHPGFQWQRHVYNDPLRKMSRHPSVHWHPGGGVDPSCIFPFMNLRRLGALKNTTANWGV